MMKGMFLCKGLFQAVTRSCATINLHTNAQVGVEACIITQTKKFKDVHSVNKVDAERDETARKAYKLLATLHSNCIDLVQMVEETGATVREIHDLEEQIETESAKKLGANLDRISADLHQMKQETAALTAQLNAKS